MKSTTPQVKVARLAVTLAVVLMLPSCSEAQESEQAASVTAKDPKRRQVFAVDNGVAFDIAYGGIWFNWFVPNWNGMRIPAVRKDSVERLRKLRRGDLDSLGVLVQFEKNADGLLESKPAGANLDADDAVRISGGTVQLGLEDDEIDDVWERIEDLLKDVDEGKVGTF